MSLYMRLFAHGGWFDRQSWQSQLWIRTKRYDVCIGRLPMYSSEPRGIWIGKNGTPKPADGKWSRFQPKVYERTWKWFLPLIVQRHESEAPTRPIVVDDGS